MYGHDGYAICRGVNKTDAIGWLEFGADGHWWYRGGMVRRNTHTEDTKHAKIYLGSGPS